MGVPLLLPAVKRATLLPILGTATAPFREEHDSGAETPPEPGITDPNLLQYCSTQTLTTKIIFLSSKEAFLGIIDVSI